MFRHLISLLVAVFCLAGVTLADPIWYLASEGQLPDFATPAWERIRDNIPEPTVSGGVLTIVDSGGASQYMIYLRQDTIADATPWVYQTRQRIVGTNTDPSNFCGIGSNGEVRLVLYTDGIGTSQAQIYRSNNVLLGYVDIDVTAWHTYNVQYNPDDTTGGPLGTVNMYIDGSSTSSLTVGAYSLTGASDERIYSSGGAGAVTVEIQNFGYNIGSTDIPEPATTCLLFIGGGLLAAWRKRK